MSRFRWWLLLLLAFLATFGTVLWWPVSPIWTQALQQSPKILGFDQQGKSVLVLDQDPVLAVTTYDLPTGQELQRKYLHTEENWKVCSVELMPGSKRLFVVNEYLDPATYKPQDDDNFSLTYLRPRKYSIIGIDDHHVVAGPFDFPCAPYTTFSLDGNWMRCNRPVSSQGYDVIETTTGKTVFNMRDKPDRELLHPCAFSPDSSAMAIQWHNKKTEQCVIEVIELPGAKSRFTYSLPVDSRFRWNYLSEWKEDRLYLSAGSSTTDSWVMKTHIYSLPVHQDRLGEPREEPQFEGFTELSKSSMRFIDDPRVGRYSLQRGDRVVQVSVGKLDHSPEWVKEWRGWIDGKLGTSWNERDRKSTRFSFFEHRSGRLLYEFGSPDLSWWQYGVSQDGRRVASLHPSKGLLLWNADPSPRWPWAWGWALLVVGLIQYVKLRLMSHKHRMKTVS